MTSPDDDLRQQVDAFVVQTVREYMDEMSMDFLAPELTNRESVDGIMSWVTDDFKEIMMRRLCELLHIAPTYDNVVIGWKSYQESLQTDLHFVDIWMFKVLG